MLNVHFLLFKSFFLQYLDLHLSVVMVDKVIKLRHLIFYVDIKKSNFTII